jgi:hypothetical protein
VPGALGGAHWDVNRDGSRFLVLDPRTPSLFTIGAIVNWQD